MRRREFIKGALATLVAPAVPMPVLTPAVASPVTNDMLLDLLATTLKDLPRIDSMAVFAFGSWEYVDVIVDEAPITANLEKL